MPPRILFLLPSDDTSDPHFVGIDSVSQKALRLLTVQSTENSQNCVLNRIHYSTSEFYDVA